MYLVCLQAYFEHLSAEHELARQRALISELEQQLELVKQKLGDLHSTDVNSLRYGDLQFGLTTSPSYCLPIALVWDQTSVSAQDGMHLQSLDCSWSSHFVSSAMCHIAKP